jgi:hypothetical protein
MDSDATDDVTPNSPNPRMMAGTLIEISAGAAIDAHGRFLSLCAPRTIDLQTLVGTAPGAPESKTCNTWLSPVDCGPTLADVSLQATRYWVVAELEERLDRPVPQYTGGGACDPSPGCQFSRTTEGVRIRLVPSLPDSYG